MIGDYVGEPITRDDPRLSGVLPTGERFQGFLPPVSAQPAFSIRKRPAVVWSLADYVEAGVLTAAQGEVLRAAVRECPQCAHSGGTGSGKTTLANAILAEPDFRSARVFLIEDTPELQCSAWDLVGVPHAATSQADHRGRPGARCAAHAARPDRRRRDAGGGGGAGDPQGLEHRPSGGRLDNPREFKPRKR